MDAGACSGRLAVFQGLSQVHCKWPSLRHHAELFRVLGIRPAP
jgi:hypothetical protein